MKLLTEYSSQSHEAVDKAHDAVYKAYAILKQSREELEQIRVRLQLADNVLSTISQYEDIVSDMECAGDNMHDLANSNVYRWCEEAIDILSDKIHTSMFTMSNFNDGLAYCAAEGDDERDAVYFDPQTGHTYAYYPEGRG